VVAIITRREFLKRLGAALLSVPAWGGSLKGQELPRLMLSLPPMIESFPIAFAYDKGIFADHGLSVELVGIADRRDRNVALFTGTVDGALTDITSVLLLIAAEAPVKITSTAYEVIDESRRYALMTHNFSYITDLETLLARLDGGRNSIGLLRKTDMEFETDRLIESRGVEVDESTQYTDFQDLVLLATLLGQGSILAAVLPEPIGSYLEYITEAEGAPVVSLADYRGQDLVPSVWIFQNSLIDGDPELIERFYAGYRQVLSELEGMPREEIIEVGVESAIEFFFPGITREELPPGAEEFLKEYPIPAFPQPRALGEEEYRIVSEWALKKGYLSEPIPFELATTDRFHEP